MTFDESYYSAGNYQDYLERGDRYKKMIGEIDDLLSKISIDKKEYPVLDFGCGVGHSTNALYQRGYTVITGYDISEWAIEYAKKNKAGAYLPVFTTDSELIKGWKYLTFMLDVLEHISIDEIKVILSKLDSQYIVFRVPVVEQSGHDFSLSVSKRDKTHITKLTVVEWKLLFFSAGYEVFFHLNLNTIWHSAGVMSVIFKKFVL